jgi:sugar (pentulose or hexulose) kinase
MSFLLLDFGASRVKSAILSRDKKKLLNFYDWSSVLPVISENYKFEVSVFELKKLLKKIVDTYETNYKIQGIFLCTEMHGFALLDQYNNPISNYISWQDERECISNKKVIPDFLKTFSPKRYLEITGMIYSSSPIANLLHIISSTPNHLVKVVTMPELLATNFGVGGGAAHVSSSAGLGIWDLDKKYWCNDIINYLEDYTKHKLIFNEVSSCFKIAGYFNEIPIYSGMGDLQCALIGAGNDSNSISVNLGTGSQVSKIGKCNMEFERRPIFSDLMMQTVTHIPSGRVLNNFINFLQELSPHRNFWNELASLSLEQIENATLDFDLSLFAGAFNYNGGGCIKNIKEKSFNVQNFLSSLLKSYTEQYISIISSFERTNVDRLIFSGGIANKLSSVNKYISYKTQIPSFSSQIQEETLEGLKKIIMLENLI